MAKVSKYYEFPCLFPCSMFNFLHKYLGEIVTSVNRGRLRSFGMWCHHVVLASRSVFDVEVSLRSALSW
jgi:hypothetical protein